MRLLRDLTLGVILLGGACAPALPAQEAASPASWAETTLASFSHTVELGLICHWTTDTPDIVHRDLQRSSTQLFQDRILKGQLMPVEAADAEAVWFLPVSFRLASHYAITWKRSGECQSTDWKKTWDIFEETRRQLPPEAPLLIRIPDESRQQVTQLKAQSCITEATLLLDDHTSGADVVAGAVRETCRNELLEQLVLRLTSGGISEEVAHRQASRFLESDELLRKISTSVLDARASASDENAASER